MGRNQPDDPQSTDGQAARATDAGTHLRRAAGAAAAVAAAARHPLRSLRRAVSPGRWARRTRGRGAHAGQGPSRVRLWVIVGLVGFVVFGMVSSMPLLLTDLGSSNDPTAAGGTLTNAATMQEAFVAAGVPEAYAADFVATANLGIDPRLVAAVAWQESVRFDEDVITCRRDSPKGAQGIMQFMPGTAAEREVDPCQPGEAITAGARYLLEIFERFDRWDFALAGYNAGPGAVAGCSCIPTNGETENYVTAVNGQWEEYKRTVPEPRSSGTLAIGANPGAPLGSTERYAEPQITATMQALLDQAVPLFGRGRGIGCYDPTRSSGEHPLGRACDFMMAAGNTQPTPEDLEHGWRFACWMVQNAEELQVRYVIWQQQIWESHRNSAPDRRCAGDRAGDGWGHYGRYDSCTDRCLQLQHYDHIHVTVN